MNATTTRTTGVLTYLMNCFWLVIPALVVNLVWVSRLPPMWHSEVFWKDIPPVIAYGERIFSLMVNVLPVFMPLRIETKGQRIGLAVYLTGFLLYFLAWVLVVYFPQSAWSTSLVGSTATAWTSVFWLIGIGLIGDSLYLPIRYSRWVYTGLSLIFAFFHTFHAVMVYLRAT